MAEFIITYRGVVYPWQCDHMGHMNVMWYVGKFDEATWQLVSMMGLTASRLNMEQAAMAAVEQHNQYKSEVHAGDPISIRSVLVRMGTSSIHVIHEMTDDTTGEITATSKLVGVYMSATERKAQPFPVDVRDRAELMINGGAPDPEARGVSSSMISPTAKQWDQVCVGSKR